MTCASVSFDIFVHNAAYAKMLFVTFPMLRVNRYYRELIDKQELTGVAFPHMCGRCMKKQTICVYTLPESEFVCLACRAHVNRPWYDSDAKQFVGFIEEQRHEFFLDLVCWGWSKAVHNFDSLHGGLDMYPTATAWYRNAEFKPLHILGKYLADPRTWAAKWIRALLKPTDIRHANDMRYILWRWFSFSVETRNSPYCLVQLHVPKLNFGEYLWNEERAWELAADLHYYEENVTDGGLSDAEDQYSPTFDRFEEEEESMYSVEELAGLDDIVFSL